MHEKKCFILIIFIFLCCNTSYGQLSNSTVKSGYIINFAKGIIWPEEKQTKELSIGVLGNPSIVRELKKMTNNNPIPGKTIVVFSYSKIKEIGDIHILFIDEKRNTDIERIFDEISGKRILLITDRCETKNSIMINFLESDSERAFEINKKNTEDAGLEILPKLLLYGGTEVDLRGIYIASEKQLDSVKVKVKRQKAELALQQQQIDKQKREIEEKQKTIRQQIAQIEKQKKDISSQQSKINSQKKELTDLFVEIEEQQTILKEKMAVLENQKEDILLQEEKIKKQQQEVEEYNNILSNQKDEIKNQQKRIDNQKNELKTHVATIKTQEVTIYIFIAFSLLIVVLVFFIFRGYKIKKEANKKLEEKNEAISLQNTEISQQKEEILVQTEKLELVNIELEKLSIVASETDNAVLIMDSHGNLEWINDSYTRMFGYTLEQLIDKRSHNIIGKNTPQHIRDKIEQSIETRETVNYEYLTTDSNGNEIWVYVTLTPILEQNGSVKKLIAIDSDITKLKAAEQEIIKQKEEIEKAYQDIKLLGEFGQKLTATLNLDWINNMIYDYVSSLMDTSAFGIGVYKPRTELIEFVGFMEKGEKVPYFTNSLEKENSLSVWCLKNQKSIFINNFNKEYRTYIEELPDMRTRETPASMIYLPLCIENKPIGIITVQSYDENAYTNNDLTMLRTLGSYIAIALDNANAYKIINTKNQHINSSIRYAQNIQKAILPIKKAIDQHFESFIIFRPKDVVSGDFYWYSHLPAVENLTAKTFIAVVDCTGHGVPGAFMSLIGNRLLNEIVNERKVTNPRKILELLNKGVIAALKQDQTDNNDGLDICLCCFEKNEEAKTMITFSGAKRPLIYYSQQQIQLLRGDRKSIGGIKSKRNKTEFTNQELILQKGDIAYLTSDGLIDQNAKNRKRFGTLRFIKLLKNNAKLSLEDQKHEIENALDFYQNKEEQRDDITVIGLKI